MYNSLRFSIEHDIYFKAALHIFNQLLACLRETVSCCINTFLAPVIPTYNNLIESTFQACVQFCWQSVAGWTIYKMVQSVTDQEKSALLQYSQYQYVHFSLFT